jgi:hypothetical protein
MHLRVNTDIVCCVPVVFWQVSWVYSTSLLSQTFLKHMSSRCTSICGCLNVPIVDPKRICGEVTRYGQKSHPWVLTASKRNYTKLTLKSFCSRGYERRATTYRLWRMASSGMLRRVALVRTDVSEELSAFFIRVTRIGELGTALAVTSNWRTLRRNTSETLVLTRATRRNIPEDAILHLFPSFRRTLYGTNCAHICLFSKSLWRIWRIGELGTTLAAVHLLSPWWRRQYVPPKRRFLQEPHGVTSQKTPFFIITAVKTSHLTKPHMFSVFDR